MGENLNLMQALYVTISSMAMVFLILLVISGILSLFKYIFKNENNIKKPNANNTCRDFVNNNSVEDNFEIDEEESDLTYVLERIFAEYSQPFVFILQERAM